MTEKKKINWAKVLYVVGAFLAGGTAAVFADIHPSCVVDPPTERPDEPVGEDESGTT